jgi:SAM-dependent methyltransferase
MALKAMARRVCPPLVWNYLAAVRRSFGGPGSATAPHAKSHPDAGLVQDLSLYWDERTAEILEHWGEGNAWSEIELIMAGRSGRVLDIACGTGRVMALLGRYPSLEVSGIDISDFLIGKAIERGLPADRLTVGDATRLQFADDSFDYAYSIGSLEHFTELGVAQFISECHRVTRSASFHMIPISRSGTDEGWIKTHQSFHNNSCEWWWQRFRARYAHVQMVDSRWEDAISLGKWFICMRSA